MGRNLWISLEIMKSAANLCGEKNRQSTANPCGARSVNFLDNHGEHSKSVWGAIGGFRWKSEEYGESVWGTLWPDFLEKEQSRAQQIRVGRNLWPDFLEKNRAQRMRVGRYVNFLDNHREHSKSVWGAICGFRLKS